MANNFITEKIKVTGNTWERVSEDGSSGMAAPTSLDTEGNPVPVWKAHSFTYDGSGNLATDTVTDGTNTWVRSYTWMGGAQTSDSGWVKQ